MENSGRIVVAICAAGRPPPQAHRKGVALRRIAGHDDENQFSN
jgi:hypothetical protein